MKLWNTLLNEREVLKEFDKVSYLNKNLPVLSILNFSDVMHLIFVLLGDPYFSLST